MNTTFRPIETTIPALISRRDFRHPLQCARVLLLSVLIMVLVGGARNSASAQVNFTSAMRTLGSGFGQLNGVAVDGSGNVFVADTDNSGVMEILASGGYTTVRAVGSGFSYPAGVAVDRSGNVFVGDLGNNAVKEIVAVGGVVSGTSTVISVGSGFQSPYSVAVDGSGNVFVADYGHSAVKEIVAGTGGAASGTVTSASTVITVGSGFTHPVGVAVDGSGNVFVGDHDNNAVKEIVAGTGGAASGTVSSSSTVITVGSGFSHPEGVAVDGSGNVFVADFDHWAVKEIIAGTGGAAGGTVTSSSTVIGVGSGLRYPSNVAVDGNGNIFVADMGNYAAKEIMTASVNFMSQSVGTSGTTVSMNFMISAGTTVGSLAVMTSGATGLDFADAGSSTCTATTYGADTNCYVNVKLTPAYPGARLGAVGFFDGSGQSLANVYLSGSGTGPQVTFGPGAQATVDTRFGDIGTAVDGSGNLYIAIYNSGDVLKALWTGSGYSAPTTIVSGLYYPSGVAVDGSGNVYIADSYNLRVVKLPRTASGYGALTTVAGGLGYPWGVAVDGGGNVYVADTTNHRVIKVPWTGSGYGTQTTLGSGLGSTWGVAVDGNGNVYITDPNNSRVVKEPWMGSGYGTQSTVGSGLVNPYGIAVDGGANVYVTEPGNGRVAKVPWTGSSYSAPVAVGSGWTNPYGVAVDGSGNVYVADNGLYRVVKVDMVDPPSLAFSTTQWGTASSDSPKSVIVSNIGNVDMTIPIPVFGNNPSVASGFAMNSATTCPQVNVAGTQKTLAQGTSCTYAVDFIPNAIGTISGSMVLKDDTLNAPWPTWATQSIALSGIGTIRMTLTASPNPSSVNQPVTLTANVSGPMGTPTGQVTFKDNGTTISDCSNSTPLDGTGSAQCMTSSLPAGTHNLTATYGGDLVYRTGSTATQTQTVNKVNSTTVMSSTPNTSSHWTVGQAVTLTATVTPQFDTAHVPYSGSVTFTDNLGSIAGCSSAVAVNATTGVATCTATALTAGPHGISATFSGDPSYNDSTSSALPNTVDKGTTTTTVASSSAGGSPTSTVDEQVTFTATVTPPSGAVVPGGTVTFTDNGNALCTSVSATWHAGPGNSTAICTTSSLTASGSTHSIVAVYNGDANYNPSTSSTLTQAVNKATTTTTVASSSAGVPATSSVDESVTFTATVTPPSGAVVPGGTVTFTDNGSVLCTSVSAIWHAGPGNSTAICTTSSLTASGSPHSIVAVYNGDANYNPSTSSTLTQAVNKATTTTTVASSSSGFTPTSSVDEQVTFTATVTPPSGAVVPGGTVTFTDNGSVLCTSASVIWHAGPGNSTATCTTSSLTASGSPHSIVAIYNGDVNYNTSTSSTLTQAVNKATTTTTVSSSTNNSSAVNQTVSFTATVAPASGIATVPYAGSVTFTENGGSIAGCSAPVAVNATTGVANCTTSSLNAGTHSIVAVFVGDPNYNGSSNTATPLSQSVSALAVTLGVTASPSSATYFNDSVTFAAQLAGAAFTPVVPGGTVSFTVGSSTISGCGAVTVNASGRATCTTASLAAGSDSIAVSYSGDANFTVASAGTTTQTVTSRTTIAASVASTSYSTSAQNVTLSATVSSDSGTVNASTVTFTVLNGGTTIGSPVTSGTVANGTAFVTYPLPADTTAGSYTIQAVFNAGGYFATSNDSSHLLSILKLTPAITWAAPSAITYGTALSATQLDAATAPGGTFAYTPAFGVVLDAGAQTLSVTFSPTDVTNYTTATKTVPLTVNPASPTLTLTCAEVVYDGDPHTCLGTATGINTVSVAGSWGFNPASETTAGTYTFTGTFTSRDGNYVSGGTAQGTLKIDKATPVITWAAPVAILYGTALSTTQLNATASVAGSFAYTPAAGTSPAAGYDTLSATFTPNDTTDYTTATSSVVLTVNNPVPVIGSMSPALTSAGSTAFPLAVNGSGFMANSVVYWGSAALATTYVSPTRLTAQIPATDVATAGSTAVTVQTPTPGGGTSNAMLFEVDTAGSIATSPTFTSLTATVTAGSAASYPVTLPSTVLNVFVTCLNLPAGATCSYSATTKIVTITTSSTTPKGTYQVTVLFTETVSGAAAAGILLPVLLLPLLFARRRLAARGVWLTACLGLILMTVAAVSIGCAGSTQAHYVTSSGAVTLTVQ